MRQQLVQLPHFLALALQRKPERIGTPQKTEQGI